MAVLVAHMEEAPPPVAGHRALGPVFAKALAKARAERYATAGGS